MMNESYWLKTIKTLSSHVHVEKARNEDISNKHKVRFADCTRWWTQLDYWRDDGWMDETNDSKLHKKVSVRQLVYKINEWKIGFERASVRAR